MQCLGENPWRSVTNSNWRSRERRTGVRDSLRRWMRITTGGLIAWSFASIREWSWRFLRDAHRGWSARGLLNWTRSKSRPRASAFIFPNWMPTCTFLRSSRDCLARSAGWRRDSEQPAGSPGAHRRFRHHAKMAGSEEDRRRLPGRITPFWLRPGSAGARRPRSRGARCPPGGGRRA
jgi:hypothetical protein